MREIEAFAGEILEPSDKGYDSARAIWNGAVRTRPALIARCASTSDVVAVVRWARERGIETSVRAGGHGVAGAALCEGLVVDLSPMKAVEVDPSTKQVHVQPGALLGELDQATQAHGLAVPAGIISHTGVSGLTLGGGIGYLMRAHGLTCDNLLEAEVVTAAGEVIRANDEDNPELLWALRGAGGTLGVATSFRFRAHALGPEVLAGPILYPAESASEVLASYAAYAAEAPREITTVVTLRWAPAAPWLPPELHGRPVVVISCIYCGDGAKGELAVRALRDLGSPLVDLIAPMPYLVHQSMYDGAVPHGLGYYWKSPYLRDLDPYAIETLAEHAWDAQSRRSYTIIFQMGGAIQDREPDATAFEDRSAAFAPNINAAWDTPDEPHPDIAWVRSMYTALEPSSTGRGYVNFQSEPDAIDAYGSGKAERLARLKRTWDPDGFFRSPLGATRTK